MNQALNEKVMNIYSSYCIYTSYIGCIETIIGHYIRKTEVVEASSQVMNKKINFYFLT